MTEQDERNDWFDRHAADYRPCTVCGLPVLAPATHCVITWSVSGPDRTEIILDLGVLYRDMDGAGVCAENVHEAVRALRLEGIEWIVPVAPWEGRVGGPDDIPF